MTCTHIKTAVLDSRPYDAVDRRGVRKHRDRGFGFIIARRRRCMSCGERFTTFELTEAQVQEFQGHIATTVREAKSQAATLIGTLQRLHADLSEDV